MSERTIRTSVPVDVPVPGGKLIREHFGNAVGSGDDISIAFMDAPAGWDEPAQTPDFDEYTLVVSGVLSVETSEGWIEVGAGESIIAPRGHRVRYANRSSSPATYWAVCTPAFTPDRANRGD